MRDDFIERVYDTMQGFLLKQYCVPGVENAFEDGEQCAGNYSRMLRAYERLCDRLGVTDEDRDVEIIIDSLLENQQILCRKMYEYGAYFAQNKPQP